MAVEIKRLHLASLQGVDGARWPVHGFVVTHPGGAVLVDTGVGGPQDWLDDWRVVNRSAADALAELDMSPADIGLVINTRDSVRRIHALRPGRVHFCHHTDVVHR